MTFNMSAVAACCARASFRSLRGPATERCLTRAAAGAVWCLALGGSRLFAGGALRAFASIGLPPVLDGRVMSAPKVKKSILSGKTGLLEGQIELKRLCQADVRFGVICRPRGPAGSQSGLPSKADVG